jgi:hypothetical protein
VVDAQGNERARDGPLGGRNKGAHGEYDKYDRREESTSSTAFRSSSRAAGLELSLRAAG